MLSNDADLTRSLLDLVSKLFSPSITKDCIRSSAQHGSVPKTMLLCMVKSYLWAIREGHSMVTSCVAPVYLVGALTLFMC